MEGTTRLLQGRYIAAKTILGALGRMLDIGQKPAADEQVRGKGATDVKTGTAGAGGRAAVVSRYRVLTADLAASEMRYLLSTGHLLLMGSSERGRALALEQYNRAVATGGFREDVDRIVRATESLLAGFGVAASARTAPAPKARGRPRADAAAAPRLVRLAADAAKPLARLGVAAPTQDDLRAFVAACGEIQRQFDTYSGTTQQTAQAAQVVAPAEPKWWCAECNLAMLVNPERSDATCTGCARVQVIDGVAFDGAQIHGQEGQKLRTGSSNPNRHFQFWWQHILAREPHEELAGEDDPFGDKLVEQMREIVRKEGKLLRHINVYDVRAMLKTLGRTTLNKNGALLLKRLTGYGPPSLPDSVALRVEKHFTRALEEDEKMPFRTDRSNRNYYPYYIWKILDIVLAPADREARRVFYYIYLQSDHTLTSNDRSWRHTCAVLGDITYVPTDRSMATRYRPA